MKINFLCNFCFFLSIIMCFKVRYKISCFIEFHNNFNRLFCLYINLQYRKRPSFIKYTFTYKTQHLSLNNQYTCINHIYHFPSLRIKLNQPNARKLFEFSKFPAAHAQRPFIGFHSFRFAIIRSLLWLKGRFGLSRYAPCFVCNCSKSFFSRSF